MESIKVLLTLRFSEELINQVRSVSPRLVVVQKSVKENWDGMDTGEFFDGDEEILYGFMPPRDLSIAPKLKWLQLHSAGINHLLNSQHPILQSNIKITTSSGIHAVPIGEFSIALMIALARRVPRMVRMQDSGVWTTERWKTFLGTELHGKTLGIIGYGSIGRHVANIAKRGFGMFIMAMTRTGERRDRGYTEPGVGDPDGALPDVWFTPTQLPDMLSQADFLLVAAPLTNETHYMIDERELRMMKPTSYVVNIARGSIINEAALIRALKENWIAGAGLDVFEKEPLPATSELWKLENAIIAPHVSSATPHYDERATDLFCENLRRYLAGDELLNLVKREIGY
ncbi:MAG: D-2-hydroxyacid dehydrogenase [Chloroflexi bacterium]|nr:D-2-hydroxyacid dehydrogenase [Chloroflexota bacterium]